MLRFEDALKKLRLKDADVVSCYLWGSRLWGTAKGRSYVCTSFSSAGVRMCCHRPCCCRAMTLYPGIGT